VISGVVLAAGSGSRFGATKQLVELGGRPLAQHAVDALAAAGVDEIVVVTGHDAEAVEATIRLPANGRFVRNRSHRDGQASSLAAGLRALDQASEAAVVLMGDQPGVSSDAVRALIDAFLAMRSRIVRTRYRDGPGPALLSREVFGQATHLHGDAGARVLMASHPDWVEETPVDADAPLDIDTVEDLRRARDASTSP
jgi:molybdenum cofactor cytidylyltransferase